MNFSHLILIFFYTQLNSEKTKHENMADNAGIIVAYNAYLTAISQSGFVERALPGMDFSPEQLFWISSASAFCLKIDSERREQVMNLLLSDVHAPPSVRLNAAFSNMAEFSRDFHCKLGSRMNPLDRCSGVRRFTPAKVQK